MNRRETKMVKGLMINPKTKKVKVVEYDGNDRFCIERLLKTNLTEYRFINGDKIEEDKVCLFIEGDQNELTRRKGFSIGEHVFFGKAVIVMLGEYENDFQFNTESLPQDFMDSFISSIDMNLKITYKSKYSKKIVMIE